MTRHALLIGVDHYDDERITPLRYAGADAWALAGAFVERCHFDEVIVLTETAVAGGGKAGPTGVRHGGRPTVKNIIDHLRRLATRLRDDSLLVFGFSGHGVEDNGREEAYLYAADSLADHHTVNSLPVGTLRDLLGRLPTRWQVLLLDACRNDPRAGKGDTDNPLGDVLARNLVGFARNEAGADDRHTAFLSACRRGQRAHEWPDFQHGVCSHYLLQGLAGPAWSGGRLTIRALAHHAKTGMEGWQRAAGLKQEPWFEQSGTEDIVLGEQDTALLAPEAEARARAAATEAGRLGAAAGPAETARQQEAAAVAARRDRMRWVSFLGFALALAGFLSWRIIRDNPNPVPPRSPSVPGDDRRLQQARDEAVRRLEDFADLTNTPALRQLEAYVEGLSLTLAPEQAEGVRQALVALRGRVHARQESDRLDHALTRLRAQTNDLAPARLLAPELLPQVEQVAAGLRGELGEQPAASLATWDNALRRLREDLSAWQRAAAEEAIRQQLDNLPGDATATSVSALDGVERELQLLRPLLSPAQWATLESALAKRRAHVLFGPAAATREHPFTNSLGMKFVPVVTSVDGKERVLFSVWETRVQDYAAYAGAKVGVNMQWKNPGFPQGENHPVVCVSWEDAQGFCAWLTARERGEGKIGANQIYRLPTDAEWSWAVGIGEAEERTGKHRSPQEKDQRIGAGTHPWAYPWGGDWPPPEGAGKYYRYIGDQRLYFDVGGELTTAVGSFGANAQGLHDLGGNVSEWVEDYYDGGKTGFRVVRGGSWLHYDRGRLLSSYRNGRNPDYRYSNDGGLRLVLVGVSVR